MSNDNDLAKRTLTLKRTLNAPIALVWKAWTESDQIVQWWCPKGMEVSVKEHEFAIGGRWSFAMLMPDGKEFITEGTYTEIEKFKKIISSADFKPMTVGVEIQALFEEAGDQTIFTFNVVHATEEYCEQQKNMGFEKGWGSTFDRLEEYLG